jgi:hypothetical protein
MTTAWRLFLILGLLATASLSPLAATRAGPVDDGALSRPLPALSETVLGRLRHGQSFTCSGRTCTQMSSCAEACHALLVCGDRRRDADNDGIPCENLCRRRC